MKRVAVVLCGSGYRDGSEIRESVAALWALSRNPVQVQCFAPDAPQTDVVNCLTGVTAAGETRNMLVEAARIARGKVQALSSLTPEAFDALVMPGGFGAAKNLCTFAAEGSRGSVRPDLQTVLEEFHAARKPIGAICIAPAIVALAFKGQGIAMTVGTPCEASQEIEKLGHKHVVTQVNEAHTDAEHKIVTSAAYMFDDAPLHEIFTGIQKLVDEVCRLAQR